MDGKIIMECLALVLIVSLAFAAVYAAEADNVSSANSTDGQGHLYISGSGDVSHVNNPTGIFNNVGPANDLSLHI